MPTTILVVDDNPNVRSTIAYLLEKEGYKVGKAASGGEAIRLLEERSFEVALIDLVMAQMDGLELLRRTRARWPHIAVILMTGHASIPSAVEAMKSGAANYLVKPFSKETLTETIVSAMVEQGLGPAADDKSSPFQTIVGSSPAITDAIEIARRAANNDKPILVTGEIGTGRENIVRAIHMSSARKSAPFLPVRCSTGSDESILVELFGNSGNQGRIVEGNGGTVYLDEVAALSPEAQAMLVRYLQDGEVARGDGVTIRSDTRIAASTSRDPEELIDEGVLRMDLFLRLKSVSIRMPSIRDRRSDLPKLVQHFAKKYRTRGTPVPRFSRDAMKALSGHPFRGNLTELEEVTEQAISLARGAEITPDVLIKLDIDTTSSHAADGTEIRTRIECEERKAIDEALRRNPRNLKQTARDLNISRTTLWRKMKKYGLEAR